MMTSRSPTTLPAGEYELVAHAQRGKTFSVGLQDDDATYRASTHSEVNIVIKIPAAKGTQ